MLIPVTTRCKSLNRQAGFTLLELSIVLVIIGLIVGGILVGQDMIKTSEIRATISQIQKYDAAVNTFRSKYGYLPGDIPAASAQGLGFFYMTTTTQGFGDGNGMLEGGGAGASAGLGELTAFWRQLTDATLIDGVYGTTASGNWLGGSSTNGAAANLTAANISSIFPPAKLGRGNYILVYSSAGSNYFYITGMTAMTGSSGAYSNVTQMTPQEGSTLDQKIDDGLPLSGSVQAVHDVTATTAVIGTAPTGGNGGISGTACVYTGGLQYNTTTPTLASTPLCQMSVRFN